MNLLYRCWMMNVFASSNNNCLFMSLTIWYTKFFLIVFFLFYASLFCLSFVHFSIFVFRQITKMFWFEFLLRVNFDCIFHFIFFWLKFFFAFKMSSIEFINIWKIHNETKNEQRVSKKWRQKLIQFQLQKWQQSAMKNNKSNKFLIKNYDKWIKNFERKCRDI